MIKGARMDVRTLHDLSETERETITFIAFLDFFNIRDILETLGPATADVLLDEIRKRIASYHHPSLVIVEYTRFSYIIGAVHLSKDVFLSHCVQIGTMLHAPMHYKEIPVSLNVAGGITSVTSMHERDLFLVIERARFAAYRAYRTNSFFAEYTPQDETASHDVISLLSELHDALLSGQLALFFQPKLCISNNVIIGAEALIRWIHPARGIIPPHIFIPKAEKTWLVHELSLFVLREGLAAIRRWQRKGLRLTVAVNVTANNIQNMEFINEVIDLIGDYHDERCFLEIEITERTILSDMQEAQKGLRLLKEQGVSVSIDDFGTGYSQIHFLNEFPIDKVKIDRRFIMDLPRSAFNQTIVKNLIRTTRELGVKTVAEGVEDEGTYDILKEFGCDVAQGYFISRPLPLNEFEDWLEGTGWAVTKKRDTEV